MAYTLYYNDKRQQIDTIQDARYKMIIVRNPFEYGNDVTKVTNTEWKHFGSKIRTSNIRICRGLVSTGFFQDDTVENTSVLFFLYYITPSSQNRTNRTSTTLIGFSLTNDLRNPRDDTNIEKDTLYIDVICVHSNIVRRPPPGGIRGAGIFFMAQIEAYAKKQLRENIHGNIINHRDAPFKILKLSALPYVISFYRYLGFRHIHKCSDLQRDRRKGQQGKWVEKNKEIRKYALKSNALRFATDTALEHAMRIELAKQQTILSKGKHAGREKAEYFRQNLNEYFSPNNIIFVFRQSPSQKNIVAIDPDTDTINNSITELLYTDNSDMFHLLNTLRKQKLSVAHEDEDTPARGTRHNQYKDSDGDIAFHSLDEGFTMRKCLQKTDKKSSQSGGKSKWGGWTKIAPRRGTQRSTMYKKCGKKCFLGPNKSFPICKKHTCKRNNKGIWSAYLRAKQQESMTHTKTQKRKYAKIANASRRLLNHK